MFPTRVWFVAVRFFQEVCKAHVLAELDHAVAGGVDREVLRPERALRAEHSHDQVEVRKSDLAKSVGFGKLHAVEEK